MKKTISTLALIVMFMPALAFAQPASGSGTANPGAGAGTENPAPANGQPIIATLPNPLGDNIDSIPALIYALVKVLVDISYVVIAFFLILSGFKFVAARGNETELTSAKNTFKYTIIGALLIIGAQTIIAVVKSIITGL